MIASTDACRTDRCRACGSPYEDAPVLDLGAWPLGNLTPPGEPVSTETFPIEFVLCSGCGLVQNRHDLPPELSTGQFRYFTSSSSGISRRCAELAEGFFARGVVSPARPRVVEVGSNEGLMLRRLAEGGLDVVGFEPVEEVARLARERHGIRTVCDVFGLPQARDLVETDGPVDLVVIMDVLELVSDPGDLLAGVRTALREGGTVFVEVPDVSRVVRAGRIDAFAHDRIFWFTVETLSALLERHGLHPYDAEMADVRGGSMSLYASPNRREPSPALAALRDEARSWRAAARDRFGVFHGEATDSIVRTAGDVIERTDRDGQRVAAYGAGIKGALLLNLLGQAAGRIEYVVDANPAKAGCRMPGTDLPVVSPARLDEAPVDALLLLAMDHRAEIERQFGRDLEIIVPVGAAASRQPAQAD